VRPLVLIAVATLVVVIYLAVVLRLPTARGMLRGLVRAGWIWVVVVVVLGVFEAWRRWA
jgi:hypothetical protein